MQATGTYYDGKTSAGKRVGLRVSEGVVTLEGEMADRRDPVTLLKVDPPLGTSRRVIRFGDGAVCEVANDAFLNHLLDLQGRSKVIRHIHGWEKSMKLALLAVVVTVGAIGGFIRWGLPVLAEQVSRTMPLHLEESLGKETLNTLDKIVLKKSKLDPERQKTIQALFVDVIKATGDKRNYLLVFRSAGEIGPNAFALPGGTVIMTDELVELAKSDSDIAGVLAHEVGHVRSRHALRHMLQNSATTLLIASITGDITSITSLAATLPTILIDAKYSRDFEREADDAAVAYLAAKGTRPQGYAEMLARLDAEIRSRHGKENPLPSVLSTHPETEERIRRIMKKTVR